MKVIHFGMGNIGRGFIAPILQKDKTITAIKFVDINNKNVAQLNKQHQYYVHEIGTGDDIKSHLITNVTALTPATLFTNNDDILTTEIVTTAIGQNNLPFIKDSIKQIIKIKQQQKAPLIIMCCENGNRVSTFLQAMLASEITLTNIYFVDCVVDRIVPNNQTNNLDVNVEAYYSWIVDGKQWPANYRHLSSLTYTNNFDGEVNKKLWLLNGVHAAICWQRYQIDKLTTITTVQAALMEPITKNFVQTLFTEIIAILVTAYHFNEQELITYTNNIYKRFTNSNMIDELARVGRNPYEKLQPQERILAPLLLALKHNLPCSQLLATFNNGVNYHYHLSNN